MLPKIASGHHGKSGCCGGLPVFGGATAGSVGVGPAGGVGAGGTVHVPVGEVIWLVFNVIAPFLARARPSLAAPAPGGFAAEILPSRRSHPDPGDHRRRAADHRHAWRAEVPAKP